MSKFYWLSNAGSPLSVADVDGYAVPFLRHDTEENSFRFSLLLCTALDDATPKNVVLVELLAKLGVDEADVATQLPGYTEFLQEWLDRDLTTNDEEEWSLYVFGNNSPIPPFSSEEVSLAPAGQEGDGTILQLEEQNSDYNIEKPANIIVKIGILDDRIRNITFDELPGFAVGASGEFRFEVAAGRSFQTSLKLPIAFQGKNPQAAGEIAQALGEHLGATFSHIGPGSKIQADGNPINVVNDELVLRTDLRYWSPGRLVATFSNTFVVPWDRRNTRKLTLEGDSLRLIAGQASVFLESTDRDPFELKAHLAFVSELMETVDQANTEKGKGPIDVQDLLLYPVVMNGATESKRAEPTWPVELSSGNTIPDAEKILSFDPESLVPSWDSNIALDQVASAIAAESVLTTFEADLSSLGLEATALKLVSEATGIAADDWENVFIPVDMTLPTGSDSSLRIRVALQFSLKEMKLVGDEFSFFVISETGADATAVTDFGLFALDLPVVSDDRLPTENDRHGYLSFTKGELVLDLRGMDSDVDQLSVFIPGGNIVTGDEEQDSLSRNPDRFPLRLRKFDPQKPFDRDEEKLFLRIGRTGVTLCGELRTGARISLISDDNMFDGGFFAEPLRKGEDGTASEVVLVDNKPLRGQLFARAKVPGTKDITGEVMARFSQSGDGGPVKFSAGLKIAGDAQAVAGSLAIGCFAASISNPRFGLLWDNGHWQASAIVDAMLRVSPEVNLQNGMAELQGDEAIIVKDLDLIKLSYRESARVSGPVIVRVRKFEFSIFGLVGIRLDGMALSWTPDSIGIKSESAAVMFRSGDGMSGGVSVGDLEMVFSGGRLRMKSINGAAVNLSVPGQFDFLGMVQWKDKGEDSYFSLSGGLVVFGSMKVDGMLLYGSDLKEDGRRVRSIAAFASRGNINSSLLPWLWLQQGGLGGAYNRELGNLSRDPTDEEILEKIDSLEPADPRNWRFVADSGTYLAVVGKLVFTSQPATYSTVCGFVLSTVLSIDTNKRIIGAGKMWLFSSQRFAEQHFRSPSIIAALKVDLRRPAITARVVTKKGSAIEALPQLKQILDRTESLLTLRLMPNLFDIYLEKLQYEQEWLGFMFNFQASWRFSLFQETMLQYVRAKITGHLGDTLEGGPGGFEFSLDMDASLDIGGIFGRKGIATWGRLDAGVSASCSAWIKIEFSVPYVKWRGLKSTTGWRTESKTYRLPRQEIGLRLTGEYAFRGTDFGGRIAVHFSKHICGQKLSISPEISIRPHVLEETRLDVRHFEAAIDRVAASATRSSGFRIGGRGLNSLLTRLSSPTQAETEDWILVPAGEGEAIKWAVLPAYCTPWFTPFLRRPERHESLGPGFGFQGHVEKIAYAVDGTDHVILPAWHSENWSDDDLDFDLLTGRARDLVQLNNLFAESAVEFTDPEQTARQRLERVPLTEDHFSIVVDNRPLQRLRDALNDDDQLQLPADVYPYSYRPQSDPNYERLQQQLAKRRLGLEAVEDGVTRWRSSRGAILALILNDMESSQKGDFSIEASKVGQELPDAKFTSYITEGASPDTVTVVRDSGPAVTNVIKIDDWYLQLRDQFILHQDCQEFREPSATDTATQSQTTVTIKLPIDIRPLFKTISESHKTTWFELIDHVRIIRGDSEVVADHVPLPVEFAFSLLSDGESTKGNEILIHPFIHEESIQIDDARRGSTDQYLAGLTYKLQIVPLGMASKSIEDLSALTLPFPTVRPFVPAKNEFPQDLGLVYKLNSPNANSTRVRIVKTTGEGNGVEFPPADLPARDFDLWYDPRPVEFSGFLSRSLEDHGAPRSTNAESAKGRAQRISAAASNQEIFSTTGLKRFQDFTASGGEATLPPGEFIFKNLQEYVGHRFYIRSANASPLAPVRELPIFVEREEFGIHDAERQNSILSVPQLEPIPASFEEQWLEPDTAFRYAPVEATENDQRHRLLIEWSMSGENPVGGIEIHVRDSDERRTIFTRRVETLEDRLFRVSQHEFHDASDWYTIPPNVANFSSAALASDELQDAKVTSSFFWEELRWFHKHEPESERECEHVGEEEPHSYQAFAELKCVLVQYRDGSADSFEALHRSVSKFWPFVSAFLADPQNDDRQQIRDAVNELKQGLISFMGGIAPAQEDLSVHEEKYQQLRTEVNKLQLSVVDGTSVEDQFDKRLDLLAARRLLALVEYRRGVMEPAVDTTHDEVQGKVSFVDSLKLEMRYASAGERSRLGALLKAWKKDVPVLPEFGVETDVFESWLAIDSPKLTEAAREVLRIRYPLSMKFFDWMVGDSSVEAWSSWRPAKFGALNILNRLKTLRSVANNAEDKHRTVAYSVPLQRLLFLTTAETKLEAYQFELRPHHSLGLERGVEENALQKLPVVAPLQNFLPDFESIEIPEDSHDDPVDVVFTDAFKRDTFSVYLNLLERLGLAVDVASTALGGLESQNQLVQRIDERIRSFADSFGQEFKFFVCRGRAPDDGSDANTETEFSFVKLITLPNLDTDLDLGDWLEDRSLIRGELSEDQLNHVARPWFAQLTAFLRKYQPEPDQNLAEIELEHQGVAWASVPLLGNDGRMMLPLPSLFGQNISVAMRPLSRYQLLAEWSNAATLQEPEDSDFGAPVSFRRHDVSTAFVDNQMASTAFGVSGGTRLFFTVAHPSDQSDSRDNLLTATRTGFRNIGLKFHERPINEERLQDTLNGLVYAENLPSTSTIPAEPKLTEDVDMMVLPNESAFVLRNTPYFMEACVTVRSHYMLSDTSSQQSGHGVADEFIRRDPSRLAHRPPYGDGTVLAIPLAKHSDLLNDQERTLLPDGWLMQFDIEEMSFQIPVSECPDLAYSYLILFELNSASGEGSLLVPLVEILLPFHPGYPPEQQDGASVRAISTELAPPPTSIDIKFEQKNDDYRFAVPIQLKWDGDEEYIPTSKLQIVASRNGLSAGPFTVDVAE